ncbi:MAG: molecular chaperone DnaJ [Candidatus Peregrinibacteria bacterium]
MPRDLYDILGVPKTASKDDLKKAYRRLSKELHPDRNKSNPEAEKKFKEVNEAYEILSDDQKKSAYDQFGTTGSSSSGPGNGGGRGPFGGFDFSGFQSGEMGGFGDIFENFFGGAGGGAGRRKQEGGRDLQVEITIEFAEVVTGVSKTFSMDRLGSCKTCEGSGAEPGSPIITCRECGGTGQVTKTAQSFFGAIRQAYVCPTCKGSGKIPEKPCKTCSGQGRAREKHSVTVAIPAGIEDGQTLRVRNEGEAGERGAASGDLFVAVRVRPDKRFERDGSDIRTMETISVTMALLGGERSVDTVHGAVTLTIPAGTQPGQVFRMKGKGLPVLSSSRSGEHYVTVKVEIPSKLGREERRILEEWKNVRGEM